MKDDLKVMTDCYVSCTEAIHHCLGMGGDHASPEHINLLMDCARICNTAVDFMARDSMHHKDVCRLCSEICRECAEDCERLAGDDEQMKQYADMCRKCSEACARMSS